MLLTMPARRVLVALIMIGIGTLGTIGAGLLAVPDWRMAHDDGPTGTFTLIRPISCDRYPPPRQRCGWFGDFVSDDGTVVRRDRELAGGLPPGAEIGDSVRARDAGSFTVIYPIPYSGSWKTTVWILAGFAAMLGAGIVILPAWSWRPSRSP